MTSERRITIFPRSITAFQHKDRGNGGNGAQIQSGLKRKYSQNHSPPRDRPQIQDWDHSESQPQDSGEFDLNHRGNVMPVSNSSRDYGQKSPSSHSFTEADPWQNYTKLLEEDQAGVATLSFGKAPENKVVAIKSVKPPGNRPPKFIQPCHPNVVTIYQTFAHQGFLFFVNEHMSVSLADITAGPWASLEEYEIAVICREILQGLNYIHIELNVSYGKFTSEDILLSSSGDVKIANIGEIFLREHNGECYEVKSLGPIMVEMMEPGTFIANGDLAELSEPSHWSDEAVSFLEHTANMDVVALLREDFLKKSQGTGCLRKYVEFAAKMVKRSWVPSLD